MAGNTTPIFSRVGDIQGGVILQNAAADYTGTGTNNAIVFTSDISNGGFVQKLRFKAGAVSNAATVARIYINEGPFNQASPTGVPGTPSGTTASTGGSLIGGQFFARVQSIDQWGGETAFTAESAPVTIAGSTTAGTITWTWTAPTTTSSAATYRLFVGPVTNGEYAYFTTNTNSYTQTVPYIQGQIASTSDYVINNIFFGEVSLPATTAIATAATSDVDYPMNIALPPGYRLVVGLGSAAAGGWYVTTIAGKY